MRVFTRGRLVAVGFVAAFVVAFAAIGAVSRSSETDAATAVTSAGSGGVPSSPWYWTMVVSPSDEDVLVVGTSKGLYRSDDGGKTWKPTGPKGIAATSVVLTGNSILAGGVRVGQAPASPVIRKGSVRTVPDGPAVLYASTDDGKTWRLLDPRGLPNVAVQSMTVDPKSGAIYALLNTGRLYRSTDAARSFRLASAKLPIPPWSIAITRDGHYVGGNMDTGHYVSANGKSWQQTPYKDSKGARHVMAYAVQPTDSTRLLMTSTGVELSDDDGKTWKVVLKSDSMFGPVAWAPSKSDVAYAVGFDRSVWRSDDGGESWKQVS